jgi:DNA-binding NarL/FixJ family response regulator
MLSQTTSKGIPVQTSDSEHVAAHTPPIRVAVLDDHHAIRVGLESAIRSQPGIVCTGTASDVAQLAPLLYRARPDVVVLDYHLPRGNGLRVCRELKRDVLAPAVVVYSAYADASLAIPAIVAGADALVDKAAPARELFEAIRCVADGGRCLPEPIPELLAIARDWLDAEDLPILEALLEHASPAQIATSLQLSRAQLDERLDGMLERVAVRIAVEPARAEIPMGVGPHGFPAPRA